MKKYFKHEDVLQCLTKQVILCGSYRNAAKKLGTSVAFLHGVIKGRIRLSDNLANKVGYKSERVFTREF